MKRFIFVALFSFWVLPAFAQTAVLDNFRGANKNSVEVSATNPMPVTGSFSASGFQPSASGARGTQLAVTTSDSSGSLPTGAVVVVSNTGANLMYCNVNGVAATTSDQPITASDGWQAARPPILPCSWGVRLMVRQREMSTTGKSQAVLDISTRARREIYRPRCKRRPISLMQLPMVHAHIRAATMRGAATRRARGGSTSGLCQQT
jgi:hypothetical protein